VIAQTLRKAPKPRLPRHLQPTQSNRTIIQVAVTSPCCPLSSPSGQAHPLQIAVPLLACVYLEKAIQVVFYPRVLLYYLTVFMFSTLLNLTDYSAHCLIL